MGTMPLFTDFSSLLSMSTPSPANAPAPPPETGAPTIGTPKEAAQTPAQPGSNQRQSVEEAFELAVYQSQMRRVSLAAQMSSAAARAGGGENGGGTAEAAAQQLTFDFFAETRTEELVRFQQRTSRVAEGLEGARRETFAEVSKRVSARFEFSATISGAALNGFANAAEAGQGAEAVMEKLTALANELLGAADDMFNEFLGMFDTANLEGMQDQLGAMMEEMLAQLLGGMEGLSLPAGTQPGGAAQAQGGGAQAASMQIQMEFEFEFSASVSVKQAKVQESDPVMFDLDGDGLELTSYRDGARFDILGNGQQVNTAFVTGGDAFLALDRNGDGAINSGAELFGDQRGAANGFEELRKLDGNGDGVIDRNDAAYDDLLLFRDNGNGLTEEGELISLAEGGIASINLRYLNVDESAAGGNRIGQVSSYTRADGTRGRAADAILNFTA